MKRIILSLLAFTCLAVPHVRADVVFNEKFDYVDGLSYVVGTNNLGATNWFVHSGTGDSFIVKSNLTVTMSGSADVNRPFYTGGAPAPGYTNSVTNIFASFTVVCTNQPNSSNYFAHFQSSGTAFQGRVWNAPGSLPGTWKLGITTTSTTLGLIRWFPVDLATNTEYQVVINWDETQGVNSIATVWVNPLTAADTSVIAADAVAGVISSAFGFRQPSGAGTGRFLITNLVVATSFDEAATNVWPLTAVAPRIAVGPKGGTNFVGNPLLLTAVAAGQNLGGLTYTWLKDGGIFANPDGNTNTLSFPSLVAGDSGVYQFVATTTLGLSSTSSVATLWVTNAPVPPTVSGVSGNTNVYYHQTATVHVTASGPPTLSYAWFYNNGPLGPNVTGDGTDTITITDVFTNNGTAGTYRCDVTNPYGTTPSANAFVTANPVPAVSIAFLRTLVDPVNYLATNSTAVWQATGTVTTFTNLTSGNTSSYYLQDGTAGINIFATLASAFRPVQGDVVTFVGVLSSFNSTLELLADTANNPIASYTVLSNNIDSLPAPRTIPFSITNNLAQTEALEGSIVMLTNVYFGASAGSLISTTAATTVTVTNAAGETFTVVFSNQDQDTAGKTLPDSATTIIGPLTQNLNNGTTPRNQGYAVTVTRFSDIVTNPITLSVSHAGNSSTLSWAAAPVTYPYSVWSATGVTGPYSILSGGLRFSDENGSFIDTGASGSQKFYRLTTP
ncbi:MAG: hypothetical protein HOP33_19705 [Verrucomicrobia bacterium]|nr:hypothetical protein [Verrucomicrobiota bacterium]